MVSTDTITGVMFAISGIVIVVGLVIHYTRPKESGNKASESRKPIATLSGVIQLLMIVVGLMVAIAVLDLVSMSICCNGTPGAISPIQHR